jgi:hypothetical protein
MDEEEVEGEVVVVEDPDEEEAEERNPRETIATATPK